MAVDSRKRVVLPLFPCYRMTLETRVSLSLSLSVSLSCSFGSVHGRMDGTTDENMRSVSLAAKRESAHFGEGAAQRCAIRFVVNERDNFNCDASWKIDFLYEFLRSCRFGPTELGTRDCIFVF